MDDRFYANEYILANLIGVLLHYYNEHLLRQKKGICIGRESNPGRPRGRRAFYH